MNKNRETKSLLAKLMAAENINVEYRENASTAAFDTEGRTLIMPVLKDMTENATDLFWDMRLDTLFIRHKALLKRL